jgi:ABC-type nickel/cobalt efflux system permease component RcnA
MRPERGARQLALAVGLAMALGMPGIAPAHPLGNFSINHYTALRTERDAVVVRYVVDLAEIPTFQEIQETGLVPETGHPSLGPYLSRRAESLKHGLRVEADGRRLDLQVDSTAIAFAPGAGALPTMRVDVLYRAPLGAAGEAVRLTYEDGNAVGRAGWREIVAAAGPGTTLAESTAPAADISRGLMDYPADLLQRPPQDVSARIVFSREVVGGAAPSPASAPPDPGKVVAAAPAAGRSASPPIPMGSRTASDTAFERDRVARMAQALGPRPVEPRPVASRPGEPQPAEPRGLDVAGVSASVPPAAAIATSAPPAPRRIAGPPSALASLITPSGLGVGIASSALLVAAALGALHALEPGHGKTVVAAYLVGARGTAWHAAMLGLIVTASHSAGVFLLGAATVCASRYVVPDRLYPWLAAGSGLAIAVLGIVLFLRRLAGHEIGHHHGPDHGHDQAHGHVEDYDHAQGHGHDHGHGPAHDHGHDHPAGRPHHDSAAHRHGHHHHHELPSNVSLGQLFTLGVSGGIVPCPAALVVLLSAISLRRVGFGLLLVAAFSAGLAAVLVAIGILMVHARRLMARFTGDGPLLQRWLPLASSAAVACFGLGITLQALAG